MIRCNIGLRSFVRASRPSGGEQFEGPGHDRWSKVRSAARSTDSPADRGDGRGAVEAVDQFDFIAFSAVLKKNLTASSLDSSLRLTVRPRLVISMARASIFSRSSGVNGRSKAKS